MRFSWLRFDMYFNTLALKWAVFRAALYRNERRIVVVFWSVFWLIVIGTLLYGVLDLILEKNRRVDEYREFVKQHTVGMAGEGALIRIRDDAKGVNCYAIVTVLEGQDNFNDAKMNCLKE